MHEIARQDLVSLLKRTLTCEGIERPSFVIYEQASPPPEQQKQYVGIKATICL